MNDVIESYESAIEYINNSLPEGFPYKLEVHPKNFLTLYKSYGYDIKGRKSGVIFLKSDLDSFIKDVLKPVEINIPEGYSVKKEDITIDYICSCVLISGATKNIEDRDYKTLMRRIKRDYPTIKVGLPLRGTTSTYLVHKTYFNDFISKLSKREVVHPENVYTITNPDDLIRGYELARDYINNNLPEGFPYKLQVTARTFLDYFQSCGYSGKRCKYPNFPDGKWYDSKEGTTFFKSDLDSYIKDALKPIKINIPEGYPVKKEDITIDYICSCVLVSDAAKSNTAGYTVSSFTSKLIKDYPTIKVGLPLKGTESTYLIHKTYLNTIDNKVDNSDIFYEITDPDDIIAGYEPTKDYINDNLPKGFPYKLNMNMPAFLKFYKSYGYYSKIYPNNCRSGSNKLVDSSIGSIFLKSDLDSYIKDALNPIEIKNPKGYSVKKEDITIDYICSCVLISDAAKNNKVGYTPQSYIGYVSRKFPTIKLGLPMSGQYSTWLIHRSYLSVANETIRKARATHAHKNKVIDTNIPSKSTDIVEKNYKSNSRWTNKESNTLIHESYLTNNRQVIDLDDFKSHIIKIVNHPLADTIKKLSASRLVRKLSANLDGLKDLYEVNVNKKNNSYVFYGDRFDEFENKLFNSIIIHNPEQVIDINYILSKDNIKLDNLDIFISQTDGISILKNKNISYTEITNVFKNMPYIVVPFLSKSIKLYNKSHLLSIPSKNIDIVKENYKPNSYWANKVTDFLPKFICDDVKKINTPIHLRAAAKRFGINLSSSNGMSKDEFDKIINTYYQGIEILNSDDDNMKEYNVYNLNKEVLDEYVNGRVLDDLADLSKGCGTKLLRRLKFPCIVYRTRYYYRKDLIEKFVNYRNNRVAISTLSNELSDKYFAISRYRLADIAKDNNVKIFEEGSDEGNKFKYILKDDIPIIEKQIIEEYEEMAPFVNIANYMFGYMERYPILNYHRVKDTISYFKRHIIKVNSKVRVLEASKRKKSPFRYIYRIISTLDKDIYKYTQEEINELLDDIEEDETQETLIEFTSFYNYIMRDRKEFNRIIITENREKTPTKPYALKDYFCLLGRILELLNDKNFIINKLYRNMNLSTSLLYVMSHYVACWRNLTIVSELPNANLSLIGFNDSVDFLDWYKQPNSKFTEKMGELICTDIENKVVRVRKTATKNNGRLLIYISKFLYKYYGLLACVCEANRCLHNNNAKENKIKDKIFSTMSFSSTVAGEHLNKFIPDLLADLDGKFSNRSANKSFETYISDKADEWNLGIGYLMSAVARGHKIDAYVLGETTKIYIDKNIDSLSFEIFSNKIFSGIKYKFMDVIYDDFNKKTVEEKNLLTNNNEITSSQIESMLKSLAIKKEEIDKFFNTYLTSKSKKRATLFEIMYGGNCHAKHNNTKCLLRAYISTDLNKFSYSDTSSSNGCIYPPTKKDCIGCSLLIAERYFLFELNYRLKDCLRDLNNCNSKMDKMIHLSRLKDLYFPIIAEATSELGEELVNEILDIGSMVQVYESNKKLIESK